MGQRIEWVSSAKGLAMIAVIVIHISYGIPDDGLFPLRTFICGWSILVFYLIAGFFLSEAKLLSPFKFIIGKAKRLYLKLLAYYIPAVLLHNVLILLGLYAVGSWYGGKEMHFYGTGDFLRNIVLTIFFAGREPIVGALWFIYVLFLSLSVLSLISWVLRKIIKDSGLYEWIRLFVLFFLCIGSTEAANVLGIYIPRFSNTLTAMWLIYCGYKLRSLFKVEFTNPWLALVSLLILWQSASLGPGFGAIGGLAHADAVSLTVSSVAALYLTCFIAHLVESRFLGNILSQIGECSFHIMALHLLAFKAGTLLLRASGILNPDLSSLLAPAQGSLLLFIYYAVLGVGLPVLLVKIAKRLRRIAKNT